MRNYTEAVYNYRASSSPAFMVRKGDWKLIIAGQDDNRNVDMLYNLDEDPSEMNNLIGKNEDTASVAVLSKAEHLKALLVKYLIDSNHPAAEEVHRRQTHHRNLTFWSGESTVHFRDTLADGTRTEYLYVGTPRDDKSLSITIESDDTSSYGLRLESQYALKDEGFSVIAVRYNNGVKVPDDIVARRKVHTSLSTSLAIRLSGDTYEQEIRVDLVPPLKDKFETSVSRIDDEEDFSDSLYFSLDFVMPTSSPTVSKSPTLSPTRPSRCSEQSVLEPKDKLYADEEPSYICSASGLYRFGLASDGDLSLWRGSTKLWSADTCCIGIGTYLHMQSRGNLVVYTFVEEDSEDDALTKTTLWSSQTGRNPYAFLKIGDEGSATIQATDGAIIWSIDPQTPTATGTTSGLGSKGKDPELLDDSSSAFASTIGNVLHTDSTTNGVREKTEVSAVAFLAFCVCFLI